MLATRYLLAVAVLTAGEAIGLLLFALVKKEFGPAESNSSGKISIVKGIIERIVIFTGLLHGFPQILIAFGAVKIATRLNTDKEVEISNNYFLIGNMVSIFMALIYTIITREVWAALGV